MSIVERDTGEPRGPAPGSAIRAAAVRAVRRAGLGQFTMVMATGIVAEDLRLDGWLGASEVLLGIAAAAWVLLAAGCLLRAAAPETAAHAEVASLASRFSWFAFVPACAVLGSRLAGSGHPAPAAALAGAALAGAALAGAALVAWLILTWLIPARLTRRRARPGIGSVNGNWYLWPVATQSLAITASYLSAGGLLPASLAADGALAAWLAGVVLYVLITALVGARLAWAGPGPAGTRAPYWVATGAASISVLAAALILRMLGAPAVAAVRPALTSTAEVLWGLATGLYLVLAVLTTTWWVRRRRWRHRRRAAWVVVFPLGMYAAASLHLGAAARLPFVHQAGSAAVWPAAAAWALALAVMTLAALHSGATAR